METRLRSLTTALDRAIYSAIDERRLVGGYVVVGRDGELVYERSAGLADREAARSFTPTTIVRFASVTKPIVSVAALRLVDEGKLALDDPITQWLPSFRPTLPGGGEPTILVRHLLTHTSGLSYRPRQPPDGPYAAVDISDGLDLPGRSLEDNLDRIASQPLHFAPGSRWSYSVGTDVLGAVLQQVSDETLPGLIRDLVTAPLGLMDTAFEVVDPSRLATPYVNDTPEPHPLAEGETVPSEAWGAVAGPRFSPSRIFEPTSFPSGGGGMAGTGPEFWRLLEAIRLDAADGDHRLLRQETARSLFEGQIGDLETDPGMTFSFAGAVVKDPARLGTPQAAGTLTWGGVYGHKWFADPVNSFTVAILTNTLYEGMNGQLTVDVRDAVYANGG